MDGRAVFPCVLPASSHHYDVIVVAEGGIEGLAHDIAAGALPRASSLVVVTDANVWRCHGDRFRAAFTTAGVAPAPLVHVLQPGEASKVRESKAVIEDWMLANECLRDTLVIAFGGGVVGDLAGFVAATYMRGVPVVQVPTTLLAMVDSAIGGKTGLDVPAGKNLVGAFHQPARVVVDTSLLETLPVRELSNGLAEVIKAGAIADAALFALIEESADALLGSDVPPADGGGGGGASSGTASPPTPGPPVLRRALDLPLLRRAIAASIAVKLRVVTADEREGGERAILNFGHTIGHAIEAEEAPAMLHGEAVAIGMVKEAEAARALGACDAGTVGRLKRVLKAVRLPVLLPRGLGAPDGVDRLLRRMAVDKKNAKDGATRAVAIKVVLLRRIGAVVAPPFAHAVAGALLRRVLSAAVLVAPPTALALPALGGSAGGAIVIRAPGSKSISNRALLLAGLAAGTTRIRGLLASDDTTVMLAALEALGARVEWAEAEGGGAIAVVTGTGGAPRCASGARTYVGNAGTASRFLLSVLCLPGVAPPAGGAASPAVLEGNARMAVRPIGPLVDALREQGADVRYVGGAGCPPLAVHAGVSADADSETARGTDGGGEGALSPSAAPPAAAPGAPVWRRRLVRLAGRVSSQYVSSVLLAAPFFPAVRAGGGGGGGARATDAAAATAFGAGVPYTELLLDEEVPTSLPYIRMTLATMADFGVPALALADNRYLVPQRPYAAPPSGEYAVEADASSASYAAALAPVLRRRVVLEGVGSGSTQGDAAFPLLLRRMGCVVEQGAARTIVDPPPLGGPGLVGVDVDMADTTDTFMTLAAVAALASGVTRIVGIGNQRVKECNRIAAMVAELAKVGVAAEELPDGIAVTGGVQPPADGAPSTVHCYDDHRIAMSFAVLAAGLPAGIVVDDAACVEKTYPEFWDVAASAFGLRVEAAASPAAPASDASTCGAAADATGAKAAGGPLSPASRLPVVVIGMRGAGKSGLAAAAAAALALTPWPHAFVDADAELEAAEGATCADVVARVGWDGFRAAELAVLRRHLAPATPRAVLATGGGVVETSEGRALLAAHAAAGGLVVEVRRDVRDIEEDLAAAGGGARRPGYAGGASLADTFDRRRQWYDAAATLVFAVPRGDRDWCALGAEFASFIERAVGASLDAVGAAVVEQLAVIRKHGGVPDSRVRDTRDAVADADRVRGSTGSSFVCIAVPDVRCLTPAAAPTAGNDDDLTAPSGDAAVALASALARVARGADAVELRADTLRRHDDEYIAFQLALLRRALAPLGTPVLFTVRSAAEGGGFCGDNTAYAALVRAGLRYGADVVDLELGINATHRATTRNLLNEARQRGVAIIGSCHWPRTAPPESEIVAASHACNADGAVDVIKLVANAASTDAALDFCTTARRAVANLPIPAGHSASLPCIAIAMGASGTLTRVLNNMLTPTTSDDLPTKAAPGQLSLRSVRELRKCLGLRPPRRYILVGEPIAASVSPALQSALFNDAYLDDDYDLIETSDVSLAVSALEAAAGGNVTIPLKSVLIPHLTSLSSVASVIGAVNTVITGTLAGSSTLHGENTDWVGLYLPLRNALRRAQVPAAADAHDRPVIVIVGAGGTAAAAGFAARALGCAPVFMNRTSGRASTLAASFGGTALSGMPGELPPARVAAIVVTIPAAAGWVPPPWATAMRPVVLDAAYRRDAPAAAAAAQAGLPVIRGLDMLVTQGTAANGHWCGRPGAAGLARGIALVPGAALEAGARAADAALGL